MMKFSTYTRTGVFALRIFTVLSFVFSTIILAHRPCYAAMTQQEIENKESIIIEGSSVVIIGDPKAYGFSVDYVTNINVKDVSGICKQAMSIWRLFVEDQITSKAVSIVLLRAANTSKMQALSTRLFYSVAYQKISGQWKLQGECADNQ